jgi:hypothetical protein
VLFRSVFYHLASLRLSADVGAEYFVTGTPDRLRFALLVALGAAWRF